MLLSEYEQERKIRESERDRAIRIIGLYHDGSDGARMNMQAAIRDGWDL